MEGNRIPHQSESPNPVEQRTTAPRIF